MRVLVATALVVLLAGLAHAKPAKIGLSVNYTRGGAIDFWFPSGGPTRTTLKRMLTTSLPPGNYTARVSDIRSNSDIRHPNPKTREFWVRVTNETTKERSSARFLLDKELDTDPVTITPTAHTFTFRDGPGTPDR